MRGGTASCTVIVADHPIGSPVVDEVDSVLALNPPSLAKFETQVVPGGLIVLNSSLVEAEVTRDGIDWVAVPATALARAGGDGRLVSMVALGALIARRPIIKPSSIEAALEELLGQRHPELIKGDLEAFGAGLALSREPETAGTPTGPLGAREIMVTGSTQTPGHQGAPS
jgi:2-oxoglutarate ferredoxin oxidoreductase subunit gamma